jgi:hypothetical protein
MEDGYEYVKINVADRTKGKEMVSVGDPCHFCVDSDLDPRIHATQIIDPDVKKKVIKMLQHMIIFA